MKTQVSIYKSLKSSICGLAIALLSVILMAPSCRQERYYGDEVYPDQAQVEVQAQYAPPPAWAPPYSNVTSVRYYYFPDYYMYYDVWSSQYVYWDGYGWVFASSYPAFIGAFNPYGAYVVVLNYGVHNPWHNHNYYVDHYPQYYYQNNYYGHRDNSVVRGYDENQGEAVFVPRTSGKGGDAQRGNAGTQQQPVKGFKQNDNGNPAVTKKGQQVPMNKGQNQNRATDPFKNQQPANRNMPANKGYDNMNSPKNFDRLNQQQQQQQQAPPNYQRQQQGGGNFKQGAPQQQMPQGGGNMGGKGGNGGGGKKGGGR